MITSLYAGILALIFVALGVYVIMGRYKTHTPLGDGGNEDLQRRVRMHGNFAEYVPLALLLLVLYETQAGSLYLIHAFGIALVAGRLSHAYALKTGFFPARGLGMALTFSVIGILGIILILKGITATQVL